MPAPELFPTKTRLKLLRDVAHGEAYRTRYTAWAAGVKVTARMDELVSAGWAVLSTEAGDYRTLYEITAAGQAVLDAHPERTS